MPWVRVSIDRSPESCRRGEVPGKVGDPYLCDITHHRGRSRCRRCSSMSNRYGVFSGEGVLLWYPFLAGLPPLCAALCHSLRFLGVMHALTVGVISFVPWPPLSFRWRYQLPAYSPNLVLPFTYFAPSLCPCIRLTMESDSSATITGNS